MADDQILISAPFPTTVIVTATDLLALSAPDPTISMKTGEPLHMEAPDPTIVFTSYSVAHGSFHITAPVPTTFFLLGMQLSLTIPSPHIEIHGQDNWYELNIKAPEVAIFIESLGSTGILRIRAPDPDLMIEGNDGTGNAFPTWNLNVPRPEIDIESSILSGATLAWTAPDPVLDLFTGGIVITLEPGDVESTDSVRDRQCVVLNTDTWEITEYTWQFDQLVKFGNTYLAIDSSGIHTLGGNTFKGDDIESIVETGLDDFGILTSKRLSNLCIGWKSVEDAVISVIMDGDTDESYEYDVLGTDNRSGSARVKVGAPRQRKHVSLKFINQGGADFDLYNMDMVLSMSIRKVQGMG